MDTPINRPYTQDQILEHEGKVGGKRNLKEVVITDDEGAQHAYLIKRPTRSVVQASGEAVAKKDFKGANKIAMGCVLEGNQDLLESDGAIYATLLEAINKIGSKTTAEIKNF